MAKNKRTKTGKRARKASRRSSTPTASALPWSAKRVHPSIVEIRCDLTRTPEQWVLLRSDAHHDNPHSLHEKEKADLDEAVKRKAIIIDIGDFFCAMGGKADPRRSRHGITRPEHIDALDYFDSLVVHGAKFLAPYARNFAIIAQGNHETSVLKHQETDLTARLVERLNTQTGSTIHDGRYGGDVCFHIKQFGRIATMWLSYHHGDGGGGLMSFGTLSVRRRASWNPMASVIAFGHIHERWALEITRRVPSSNKGRFFVDLLPQHHVCCGTLKDEYGGMRSGREPSGASGWHVERGAPPKPIGSMWMRIVLERGRQDGRDRIRPRMEFIPT